jgi:L-lactate dehydrogenase (cytochrome)
VSRVDTTTTVLGTKLPVPFVLAPVGAPRLFHHEGELAAARAAGHAGVPYGVSTMSTQPLEDIAAVATGPLWFQLYLWGDRAIAKDLVQRAHAAGYRALLLTVDSTVRSHRERELRQGIVLPTPQLTPRTVLDGALHPRWAWRFLTSPAVGFSNLSIDGAISRARLSGMFDGSVTWDDLRWLRDIWPGPILIKGVLRASDAKRAADEGVEGVVVSNHGGRQLDHSAATVDVLPEIVDAVADRIEVLVDSGVRRGTDILAALALGAKAVLVGRAYLYGLAAAGEPGVRHAIDILTEELRIAMALSGVARIADVDSDLIRRVRS